MKVAIATHFPKDVNTPKGGVEAVSVNLVKGLATLEDVELHIVTLDTGIHENHITHHDFGKVHRLAVRGGSVLLSAQSRWRKVLQGYLTRLQPTLVHSHDTYGIITRGLKIPRVFTIHGFIYGDTLLQKSKFAWIRSKLWKIVETRAWADQPCIISISPYVRERLTGNYRGVIYDIDNPVAEPFFNNLRMERKGRIFSAAVISPRKNTLTLVRAFARIASEFPDASLRLAGPVVDEQYGQEVKKYIAENDLSQRVLYLGNLTSSQIRDELVSASIFALVSLEENSPMGIEEAMAAGVPVITSNRCGMPYMVQHGESGYLVRPERSDEIAERIRFLLKDDVRRESMGIISREIALRRFHPIVIAKKTRQVYLESLPGFGESRSS